MIDLKPSALEPEEEKALIEIFGPEGVSTRDVDRIAYSRDCWPMTLIWIQGGKVPYPPDAVVWAESTDQIVRLMELANERSIPVIPYGGGSGVCGGTLPIRGGICLDVKRMDAVLHLDEKSLLVDVEPGMNGQRFEDWLNARGYTLGHFPSSIYCSTVGGWVAARSAGQLSTRYGKIEDMIRGLEIVLPSGRVATIRSAPRRAVGPDFLQLFVGSEGTLGVMTRVTLLVRPLPPGRLFRGFFLDDVPQGIEAIRRVMRTGIKPAAVRLYDALDTFFVGKGDAEGEEEPDESFLESMKRRLKKVVEAGQSMLLRHPGVTNWLADIAPGRCLLLFSFEGEWDVIKVEEQIVRDIALEMELEDLGPDPARRWWNHRYDVSYKQSKVFESGAFVDTMEVSAPWGILEDLYRAVREALRPHAVVLAHFSHAYEDGCNIYFTFASMGNSPEESEQLYRTIWREGLEAVNRVGAAISHHHGIGYSKQEFMEAEWGRPIQDLYRSIKESLDPNDILNPGKMGL